MIRALALDIMLDKIRPIMGLKWGTIQKIYCNRHDKIRPIMGLKFAQYPQTNEAIEG